MASAARSTRVRSFRPPASRTRATPSGDATATVWNSPPSHDTSPAVNPHRPFFDFDATAAGAEWIDDLARRSLAVREETDLPRIVTHTDWTARNVRFRTDGVKAIYDWDSASAISEAGAVGGAAQAWRSFARWDDEIAPTVDEVLADFEAHGEARGRSLTHGERRAAAASALWVLAYSARCEHSITPTGHSGRCRSRLHADGDLLLRSV